MDFRPQPPSSEVATPRLKDLKIKAVTLADVCPSFIHSTNIDRLLRVMDQESRPKRAEPGSPGAHSPKEGMPHAMECYPYAPQKYPCPKTPSPEFKAFA